MALVDQPAAARALRAEAEKAAALQDGHRAWVVRDSLSKLEAADAGSIRERLGSIRRRANAPSTSEASELATRFADIGLGRRMPEPPLA